MDEVRLKQVKEASKYGQKYAEEFFESMRNPENQGPTFDWSKFPNMVAGIAAASCWTAMIQSDMESIVKEAAFKRAKALIEENEL